MSSHVVQQHRLLAEPLVTLSALEAQFVVHVFVLVLQTICTEHFSAEPAGETFLIFGRVLVHKVFPKAVYPLERLAFGYTVLTEAKVPPILHLHRHVHLGDLHVRLVGFGVLNLLRNLIICNLVHYFC